MALMPTDLPDPVVPATNRCGIRARSATTAWPLISLPRAIVSAELASANTLALRISDSRTVWRLALGNSSPMTFLPGMVSTTRSDVSESARARSLPKLTIWLPLTPVAGSISYRVITGPGCAVTTLAATPKSASFFSMRREVYEMDSGLTVSTTAGGGSSNATLGLGSEPSRRPKSDFCASRSTRTDFSAGGACGSIRNVTAGSFWAARSAARGEFSLGSSSASPSASAPAARFARSTKEESIESESAASAATTPERSPRE